MTNSMNGPNQVTPLSHDKFQKELQNLSKKDGVWNGYLIVNKHGDLERVNVFKFFLDQKHQSPEKVNLKLAIINYLSEHREDIQNQADVRLVVKLAKRTGLMQDPSIKTFINDIRMRVFERLTLEKNKQRLPLQSKSINKQQKSEIDSLREKHLPSKESEIEKNTTADRTEREEENEDKNALAQEGQDFASQQEQGQNQQPLTTPAESDQIEQESSQNIPQELKDTASQLNIPVSVVDSSNVNLVDELEQQPAAQFNSTSKLPADIFYEKLMGSSYNNEKASDYENAINNILDAVQSNNPKEVKAWLGMIHHSDNKFSVLATAYQLAKSLGITPLESSLLERLKKIDLDDVKGMDLNNLKWDPLKEPYGLIYATFQETTGNQFRKEMADDLDNFIYDIFYSVQDADLEDLKKYFAYTDADNTANRKFLLVKSLDQSEKLIHLANDKLTNIKGKIESETNPQVSKELLEEQNEIQSYIKEQTNIQQYLKKELSQIQQAEEFLGIPLVLSYYNKAKAGGILEIFRREEATEERTKSTIKMAFAVISILGTFTAPAFKHLERGSLVNSLEEAEAPPATSPAQYLQISDKPHNKFSPEDLYIKVPEGFQNTNSTLFGIPKEVPPQPPLASSDKPHQPQFNFRPHPLIPRSIDTPTVYPSITHKVAVPHALPATVLSDMGHSFTDIKSTNTIISGAVVGLGALILGVGALKSTFNYLGGFEPKQEVRAAEVKKTVQPKTKEVEKSQAEAEAPIDEESIEQEIPAPIQETLSPRELIAEAIKNNSLKDVLATITPDITSLNTFKELLDFAITSSAKHKTIPLELFEYTKGLVSSNKSLPRNLGIELMQKLTKTHAENPVMAAKLLEYASTISSSETDQYVSQVIAKGIVEDKNYNILRDDIKKNPEQAVLILQGAALSDLDSKDVLGLIGEASLKKFDLKPFLKFCLEYNPNLFRKLHAQFKLNAQKDSFYRALMLAANNAVSNAAAKNDQSQKSFLPPFKENIISTIATVLSDSNPAAVGEQEWSAQLKENPEQTFQVLEHLQQENVINQEDINNLISAKFIQSLKNPEEIVILQSRLNADTDFNKMVIAAVAKHSADEVTNALTILRNLNKKSTPLDVQTAWEQVISGPDYFSLDRRSEMGLQVYTRISYDLVLNQIENRLSFDANGALNLPENDPAVQLHQEICKQMLASMTPDEAIGYIKQIPDTRGQVETQNVLRTMLLQTHPENTMNLLETYTRQMAQGDTSVANFANQELRTLIVNVDRELYPSVANHLLKEGGIKGRQLTENLFDLSIDIDERELVLEILENYCFSEKASPIALLKMLDDLKDLNPSESRRISNLVHFAIDIFLTNNTRIDYVAPLVEWMIYHDPKQAKEVLKKDLLLPIPKFRKQMENFVKELETQDSAKAMELSDLLYNHGDTIIKAAGSVLFHQHMTNEGLKLPKVYPKPSLYEVREFLGQLIRSDIKDPLANLMRPLALQIVKEHPDLNVVIEEVVPEMSQAEQDLLSHPRANFEGFFVTIPSKASDYLKQIQPSNEIETPPNETLSNLPTTIADVRSQFVSSPTGALNSISEMLQNPSMRVSLAGEALLLEMADKHSSRFEVAKEILKTCTKLPQGFNDLKLSVASNIAAIHTNQSSLEGFLAVAKSKNEQAIGELFFKGMAAVNSNITVYLRDLNSSGINIRPMLDILKIKFPNEAAELSGTWKQILKLKNLGTYAGTLSSAPEPSFETKFRRQAETILQRKSPNPEMQQGFMQLLSQPKSFMAALESTDPEEALLVTSVLMREAFQPENPAVLSMIKANMNPSTYVGKLINKALETKINKDLDKAFEKIRVNPKDEKVVSQSINPLKIYLTSFPYEFLTAMDQKFPENSVSKISLKEAVCKEFFERTGKNEIFSLLFDGIKDEYFEPDSTTHATLSILQDLLLAKHPETFPILALNYLNEMNDASRPERAATAKKELEALLSRETLKPYVFQIANAAVAGMEGEVVPLQTQRFIENILYGFIQSKHPTLALEVLQSYAFMTPEPLTLLKFVDQISKLPLSKLQQQELGETIAKATARYIAQDQRDNLLTPLIDWLIENEPNQAFILINNEIDQPNPIFQRSLPGLLQQLIKKDHHFSNTLFTKLIIHPNTQVRAAGTTLIPMVTTKYQDPSLPEFLTKESAEGMLSSTFQILDKAHDTHQEALDLFLPEMQELSTKIDELEFQLKSIPETTVDQLIDYIDEINDLKSKQRDFYLEMAVLYESNSAVFFKDVELKAMIGGFNEAIADIDEEINKLKTFNEPYRTFNDNDIHYINLKQYLELENELRSSTELYNSALNVLKESQEKVLSIQKKQGILIELAKRLKQDIPLPIKEKTIVQGLPEDVQDVTPQMTVPKTYSSDEYINFENEIGLFDPLTDSKELNRFFEQILSAGKNHVGSLQFLAVLHSLVPPQTDIEAASRRKQIQVFMMNFKPSEINSLIDNSTDLPKLSDLLALGLEEISKTPGVKSQGHLRELSSKLAEKGIPAVGQTEIVFGTLTLKRMASNPVLKDLIASGQTANPQLMALNQQLNSMKDLLNTEKNVVYIFSQVNEIPQPEVKKYIISQLIEGNENKAAKFSDPEKLLDLFSNDIANFDDGLKNLMSFEGQFQARSHNIEESRSLRNAISKPLRRPQSEVALRNIGAPIPTVTLQIPDSFDESSLKLLNDQIRIYKQSIAIPQDVKTAKLQELSNALISKLGETPNIISTLASFSHEYEKIGDELAKLSFDKLSNLIQSQTSNDQVMKFINKCVNTLPNESKNTILDLIQQVSSFEEVISLDGLKSLIAQAKLATWAVNSINTQTVEIIKKWISKGDEGSDILNRLSTLQTEFKDTKGKNQWAGAVVNALTEANIANSYTSLNEPAKSTLKELVKLALENEEFHTQTNAKAILQIIATKEAVPIPMQVEKEPEPISLQAAPREHPSQPKPLKIEPTAIEIQPPSMDGMKFLLERGVGSAEAKKILENKLAEGLDSILSSPFSEKTIRNLITFTEARNSIPKEKRVSVIKQETWATTTKETWVSTVLKFIDEELLTKIVASQSAEKATLIGNIEDILKIAKDYDDTKDKAIKLSKFLTDNK